MLTIDNKPYEKIKVVTKFSPIANIFSKDDGSYIYHDDKIINDVNGASHPIDLYFLSDDKIKEGDWMFNTEHLTVNIAICDDFIKSGRDKKIIATTNSSLRNSILQIPKVPEDFLKLFCEKNGIFEVLVQYKVEKQFSHYSEDFVKVAVYKETDTFIPYTSYKNGIPEIEIKVIEDIEQDNIKEKLIKKLEEMKGGCWDGWSKDAKNGYLTAVITIQEWIKENIKILYTEQEVFEVLESSYLKGRDDANKKLGFTIPKEFLQIKNNKDDY